MILTFVSHQPNFLWEPRGFTSIEEMNEAIIERWNHIVNSNDRVIHLGDTMLNDNEKGIEYLKRLHGEICLVYGNHDSPARQKLIESECPNVIILGYAHVFKHGKLNIYLSHYPTLTANYDEKHFSQHVINFHGHTHQKTNWINPSNPFTYHVGMDSHNCTPIHIEEAISDIKQRWHEIGQLPSSLKPEDTYPYNGMFGDKI